MAPLSIVRWLPLVAIIVSPAPAAAQVEVDCPGGDLTSYLVGLLDVLYANGLTTYEQLVANVSETDTGYDLLVSLYSASATTTLLPPTDAAFAAAGINPPFDGWTEWEMVGLFALHTVQGTAATLVPAYPLHGIGTTMLAMQGEMNSTVPSTAEQVVVLVQNGTAITVDQTDANATSWQGGVDMSASGVDNLAVLPLDTVLTPPSNLTETLAIEGLGKLSSALGSSTTDLEQLTTNGFTIFAPVDSAWSSSLSAAVSTDASLLKQLYTTSYTLYSPAWYDSGTFPSLALDSGDTASVTYNGSGHFVTLGAATARILRPDVTLENGVMHVNCRTWWTGGNAADGQIIDTALIDMSAVGTASTAPAAATSSASAAAATAAGDAAASGTTSSGAGPATSPAMYGALVVAVAAGLAVAAAA